MIKDLRKEAKISDIDHIQEVQGYKQALKLAKQGFSSHSSQIQTKTIRLEADYKELKKLVCSLEEQRKLALEKNSKMKK